MKLNMLKHFPKDLDLALVILFTLVCIQTFSLKEKLYQKNYFLSIGSFFQTLGKFNHQTFKKGLIQTLFFQTLKKFDQKCCASFAKESVLGFDCRLFLLFCRYSRFRLLSVRM